MYRSLLVILSLSGLVTSSSVRFSVFRDRYDDMDYGASPKRRLVQKGDLYDYIESLQKIIEFCSNHKYDLDMNLEFGLFLTNVNLKLVLKNKSHKLQSKLRNFLKNLIDGNNELIEYFEFMSHQASQDENAYKMIASLFSNETKWMNRVRKYTIRSPLYKKSDRLHGWQKGESTSIYEYIQRIKNFQEWVPTPKLSDKCFRSLASNNDQQLKPMAKCTLHDGCYSMLKRGSDFGYALSHRLLLLLNARLGRGCHIFSSDRDRELTQKFCKLAYDELQYVTTQGYEIIDLILEFISLCALDGHAHFLRQDWLSASLRFQAEYGCFGVTIAEEAEVNTTASDSKDWELAKKNHQILGGLCDGHVTSVAAGALSAAIRYIIEDYY